MMASRLLRLISSQGLVTILLKDKTSQESTSSSSETQDVDSEAKQDYDQSGAANLILHVKLYIIGDKYDIQALRIFLS